ncbi:MAG: non-heme iron oxygenase ferredoxin subunit [Proteobacteria bacterium]|nr:non-heme iron oxygenase ferredoxin subunit [Pseudomonadota bacterium]
MTETTAECWISVARKSEVEPGAILGLKVGDRDIAVYNVDGIIYASNNVCTHAHAYLSDGWLEGDVLECPLHGGRFEAKTGRGMGAPIICDLKLYAVRVEGDDIQINLS